MVANLTKRAAKSLIAAIAGYATIAATPALADVTNAADVAAPAPKAAAEVAVDGAGDEDFRQLFAQWKKLDNVGKGPAPAPVATVSVPSRMPLDMAQLTSDYGMRTHPVLGGKRRHNGVDLAAPTGTPVYATADGTVSRADRFSSYGLYIAIEHGSDIQTRFAHLSRLNVRAGQEVKKGELIGFVGSTGRSTGPHLHYEVRIDGRPVNPVPYMAENDAQQAYAMYRGEGGRGGAE